MPPLDVQVRSKIPLALWGEPALLLPRRITQVCSHTAALAFCLCQNICHNCISRRLDFSWCNVQFTWVLNATATCPELVSFLPLRTSELVEVHSASLILFSFTIGSFGDIYYLLGRTHFTSASFIISHHGTMRWMSWFMWLYQRTETDHQCPLVSNTLVDLHL